MLKLILFGSPQVFLAGEQAIHFVTNKTEALLYYLALTGKPHSRYALASLLWPDATEESARKNLRDALYGLRRRLDDYLYADRQILAFNRNQPYFLDVESFRNTLVSSPERVTTNELQAAVDLYQGDLLAGFAIHAEESYEEWLRFEREHLRMLAARAMQLLAARYLEAEQWNAGLEITQRLLTLDAYDEAAHRQRIRMLAACGQYNAAIAQYEQCQQLLATEMGVAPSRETQTLLTRIRSGWPTVPTTSTPALLPAVAFPMPTVGGTMEPARPATLQTDLQFDDGDLFRQALFLGRAQELAQLTQFLTDRQMRLITILGTGGQGKTTLAAALVFQLTSKEPLALDQPLAQAEQSEPISAPLFQRILWRSLRNAPPLNELLNSWLKTLLDPTADYQPLSLEQQLQLLLDQLQRGRYLLILDNFESILDGDERAGLYRAGYEAYAQLLQRMATYAHQSCLLLTSRELPLSSEQLESNATVATLHLSGLPPTDAMHLLQKLSIDSDRTTLTTLVNRYSGNPLALKLAAQTVQNLFGGSLVTFIQNDALIFDGIRHLLDQQFQRLSPLEAEILVWLAIEREAVAPHVIWDNFTIQPLRRNFLEALRALQRRALLEIEEPGRGQQPPIRLALPNFWIEYLTDRLVETFCDELFSGHLDWFNRYAICKAQSKEYLREVRWRLLAQPIAQRLQSRWRQQTATHLTQILNEIRHHADQMASYAGANLLHLFRQLNLSLAHLNFSQLAVWNADLRQTQLQQANFTGADLTNSIFIESFNGALALAFSPDGKLLAAATTDGNIYFWNVADHQLIGIGQGNGRWIWALAFSADGHYLASGGADQIVRLWPVDELQMQSTDSVWMLTAHNELRGHTETIFTLAFTPDSQQLATGSADQTIRLWQVKTGTLLSTLHGNAGVVFALAIDATGSWLASAGQDRTVQLWDLATQKVRHHCVGHTEAIITLLFHTMPVTGITWLISGSRDHTVRLWSLDTGELQTTLADANDEVLALAASPHGNLLAASGADQLIRFWDLTTMQLCYSINGHLDAVRTLAFHPDGVTLASGGNDQTIRLWDTTQGRALYTIQGYKNAISALAISPDRKILANGNANHVVHLWTHGARDNGAQDNRYDHGQPTSWYPTWAKQPHQTLHGHVGTVRAVAFHPSGALLASGGDDDQIRLWQPTAGQWHNHQLLRGHTGAILAITFSPDGRWLATSGADNSIRLWDLQSNDCISQLRAHRKMVNALAFSPDGKYLASADDGGLLRLHQVNDLVSPTQQGARQAAWEITTNNSALFTLAFSPDSQLLASGGTEKSIQIWHVSERRLVASVQGHESSIYALAFSPDGRYLASSGGDQQIRLWSLPTGTPCRRWSGHQGLVSALIFDATGGLLISGSADQTIRLWPLDGDAHAAQLLQPPGPYSGMNLYNTSGLTPAKRAVLKKLGAIEQPPADTTSTL